MQGRYRGFIRHSFSHIGQEVLTLKQGHLVRGTVGVGRDPRCEPGTQLLLCY